MALCQSTDRCSEHSSADVPVYGCKSSCHSCPALHRRTGPLAPRDNHSLAEGHWFFHRLLLTEHFTDPVFALQTHAYGFQRGPGGRLSGLQPPSECMPC